MQGGGGARQTNKEETPQKRIFHTVQKRRKKISIRTGKKKPIFSRSTISHKNTVGRYRALQRAMVNKRCLLLLSYLVRHIKTCSDPAPATAISHLLTVRDVLIPEVCCTWQGCRRHKFSSSSSSSSSSLLLVPSW